MPVFICWHTRLPACRACDDIRDGYRKYHIGRHLIFYREADEGIVIIRILHDRMDVEAHFDED